MKDFTLKIYLCYFLFLLFFLLLKNLIIFGHLLLMFPQYMLYSIF